MAKRGFTLAELLITVVILAVLAAIALPNFGKSIEKAKWNQAFAALRVIRTGELMYFAKNKDTIPCADVSAIRTNLGANVTDDNFLFKVDVTLGALFPTFTVTATRKTDATQQVQVAQNGVFSVPTGKTKPAYVTLPPS